MMKEIKVDVVVLGAGPGGYSAAFRAADLGKKVIIVEQHSTLGGVCLNTGCIPSKAFLHAAKLISDCRDLSADGLDFGVLKIDVNKLRDWKNRIVAQLTGGLKMLTTQRNIEIVRGVGKFISPHQVEADLCGEKTIISFEHAIIAVGSRTKLLPHLPDDRRIMTSTRALSLQGSNARLLVIGAGIIGLEMSMIYHTLGAEITMVELEKRILINVDQDVSQPLQRRITKQYKDIYFNTSVSKVEAKAEGIYVWFSGEHETTEPEVFDNVLCVVGRESNAAIIDSAKAGIETDKHGFIIVDDQQRTNVSHILAVGDVVGAPMLAHKAIYEGRIAAEVIAGMESANNDKLISAVAYTDPEVAWVGLTEEKAVEQGIDVGVGKFPWLASGRAHTLGRTEGLTKIIFDKTTEKIIGAEIVGVNAGELIAELTLAIKKGCTAKDITSTIHPHPTLSETNMMSAEVFEGTVTDLLLKKSLC